MNIKQKTFAPLIFIGILMTALTVGCTRYSEELIPFVINAVAPNNLPDGTPELNMATVTVSMTNQRGITFTRLLNSEGSTTLYVEPGTYSVLISEELTTPDGEIIRVNGTVGIFTVTRSGIWRTSVVNDLATEGHFDTLYATETHFLNEVTVPLEVFHVPQLIIREIYFGGGPAFVRINEDGDSVFANWNRDQFIEVFNNSNRVIYLDSLIIGSLQTANSLPHNPWNNLAGKVAFHMSMWMVPGNGTCHPLQPGQGAVFAPEAVDHGAYPRNALAGLELNRAHFAMFNAQQHTQGTAPAPGVITLDMISSPSGNRWAMSVHSPAIVIARIPNFYENWYSIIHEFHLLTPGSTSQTRHWTIREEWIIDGVDITTPATGLAATKRVPRHIDASVVWLNRGNGVGDALTRRLDRIENGRRIYQVTGSSNRDFITARPNPNLRP